MIFSVNVNFENVRGLDEFSKGIRAYFLNGGFSNTEWVNQSDHATNVTTKIEKKDDFHKVTVSYLISSEAYKYGKTLALSST